MSSPRIPKSLVGGALAVLLASCGTRGELYTTPLKPLPLVGTASTLVQVVPQTRRAVVITPGERTPVGLTITAKARTRAVVPGTDLLAILSGTPRAPRLDVVDTVAREVVTLETPGFFDAISFSPDGRFGLLSYAVGGGTGALTARNLNEVGLWAVGSERVERLQLDTESLAPRSIVFAAPQDSRQLVAVTLERGVAVFDALHPEVAPRRISLRPQGSLTERSVVEAVFSPNARWLFLRTNDLDDVIAVELGPEVGQPLSASINFVAGGTGLADIEAPPPGLDDAVLALYSGSKEAWLLDARGIQDRAKRLGLTEPFNRLQLLDGSRVLIWSQKGRSVVAWDVADGRSGAAALDGAFDLPVVLPSLGKALFPHARTLGAAAQGPSLSTVTVVDETNRLRLRLQAIQLSQQLATSAVDGATRRVFFTVASSPAVVTMDLGTLQLGEVALDADAAALLHVPVGDWLAVDHAGAFGDVTVVPAGGTDRAAALRYADFALTDEFERPEDAP